MGSCKIIGISQFTKNFEDELTNMMHARPDLLNITMQFETSTKKDSDGFKFINPEDFRTIVPPRPINRQDEVSLLKYIRNSKRQNKEYVLLHRNAQNDFTVIGQISAVDLRFLLNQAGIYRTQGDTEVGRIITAAQVLIHKAGISDAGPVLRARDVWQIQAAEEGYILKCLMPLMPEPSSEKPPLEVQLYRQYAARGPGQTSQIIAKTAFDFQNPGPSDPLVDLIRTLPPRL